MPTFSRKQVIIIGSILAVSQVDIVDSLNVLLRGSQSHLQAFSRQLG